MTIPGITPTDWARMSWHQRDRARRRVLAALEAERPTRRVEPVIVGPYSRLDALHTNPTGALRLTIALLAAELDDYDKRRDQEAQMARWGRPDLSPCGTVSAYRRHLRRGESCRPCRKAATAHRATYPRKGAAA